MQLVLRTVLICELKCTYEFTDKSGVSEMRNSLPSDQYASREGYASVEKANLFYREVGQGRPILIIHGGPDFDHTYLLPDMDRLSDAYHLIYYDLRGRGKSASLYVSCSGNRMTLPMQ